VFAGALSDYEICTLVCSRPCSLCSCDLCMRSTVMRGSCPHHQFTIPCGPAVCPPMVLLSVAVASWVIDVQQTAAAVEQGHGVSSFVQLQSTLLALPGMPAANNTALLRLFTECAENLRSASVRYLRVRAQILGPDPARPDIISAQPDPARSVWINSRPEPGPNGPGRVGPRAGPARAGL